ncbi:MAG: polyprenol monophosphomannose synthase [Kineosporiaceae bacterium]|nr:polyprenol monophosphomannose synthase [Kineosporiaceae bacterium]
MTGSLRPLVIIPTYDERQNLPTIVRRVRQSAPEAHVLVADDNSPDGTGVLADGMAVADDHLHVLHRPAKQGLGAAYLDGFRWGIEHGFDVLIEFDADGSHPPERLPAVLERIEAGADLVIGSRWVAGGSVVNWPRSRQLLSQGGNLYTRLALGIPVRDATAGFRAFRAEALGRMRLEDVQSQGYCFQVDLTWRAVQAGLRIEEVPITFVEREHGTSKMSRAIVLEALWRVTQWGVRRRWARLRRTRPAGDQGRADREDQPGRSVSGRPG